MSRESTTSISLEISTQLLGNAVKDDSHAVFEENFLVPFLLCRRVQHLDIGLYRGIQDHSISRT